MQTNGIEVKEFEDAPIETVKLLIENGRPITVFAPIIIVSIYFFIYTSNFVLIDTWIDYFLLLFGVVTLRMGINNVNNVYDVEIDKINKPHRPIPRGDLEKESAFIIGTVIQFISLFVFMLLSLEAFLLNLSFVVVGWLYNIDNGLKNYFPINNLIIGYVRGFGYLLALMVVGVDIDLIHLVSRWLSPYTFLDPLIQKTSTT
ncbi:MAG: UbiA family prenyltransferase [Candidatus Kariarchaeaceae archaeon]